MISIITKLTFRNFLKNKLYHFISISSQAIAIACFFFTIIWVNYELSFDSFHPNSDRLYRITIEVKSGDYHIHFARTSDPILLQMPDYFSEIEEMVRLQAMKNTQVRIKDINFLCNGFFNTDSSFFNIFGYKLLIGDPHKVLAEPKSLVISKNISDKYFAKTDPIGQEIYITQINDTTQHMYTITGVMDNFPQNSHFHADILASFSNPEKDVGWAYYYILLKDQIESNKIIQTFPKFLSQFMADEYVENITPHLQLISDIHLRSEKTREIEQNGNIMYLIIFEIVSLVLLIIAFINYANLQVVVLNRKLSFIFLNRIVGAKIKNIASFIGFENLVIQILAISFGLTITFLGIPMFNKYFGYNLGINDTILWLQIIGFSLIVIVIGLIIGISPVFFFRLRERVLSLTGRIFYHSSFESLAAGKMFSGRKFIIILQFFASITLIICTVIIYQQVNYLLNSGIGGGQENIMVMKNLPRPIQDKYKIFKRELLSSPLIKEVTASKEEPSYEPMDAMRFEMNGIDESLKEQLLHVLPMDNNYLDFFNIRLIAGRKFPTYAEVDSQEQYIINESTLKLLGFNFPEEILEKQFKLIFYVPGLFKGGEIIGVSEDFHSYNMTKKIKPLVMFQKPMWYFCFLIKIDEGNFSDAIAYVKTTWDRIYPDYPFTYDFVHDLYLKLYKREIVQKKVLAIISILTIIIACLGLVGLMIYLTEMRTKEIGIRKVNGASILSIIYLLNRNFVIWISIAFLLAIPTSLYLMSIWLNNFAYQINISWWMFIIVFFAMQSIIILTVSFQSFKAASRNPVESIRHE